MKMSLLVVLLALSPSAWAQNKPAVTEQESLTVQIKADRAKAEAREERESKKRPWDRDADGMRPWDRKEVPVQRE
jgi:hypothetical protein